MLREAGGRHGVEAVGAVSHVPLTGANAGRSFVLERSVGHLKFPAVLFSIFAALALALVALGVFGIASQPVVQRRRELGIRIALGARAAQVSRMVVGQSFVPVASGLVIGIGGAVAFTQVPRGLLFEIQPTDPVTIALGVLVLAAATLLSCLVPAPGTSGP